MDVIVYGYTKFLSTSSSQRATVQGAEFVRVVEISIHALFAEGDSGGLLIIRTAGHFYPRPLRRGRHFRTSLIASSAEYFYPRPLRRGRLQRQGVGLQPVHFYPRPLRRGRRQGQPPTGWQKKISIHALFAEGDYTS